MCVCVCVCVTQGTQSCHTDQDTLLNCMLTRESFFHYSVNRKFPEILTKRKAPKSLLTAN